MSRGEFVRARSELQSMALPKPQHQTLTSLYGGVNPQLMILSDTARTLWPLGYPEQARRRSHEALQMARERAHPYSLAHALYITAWLHPECGEGALAQEHAEAAEAVCREHGFPYFLATGTAERGQALIVQRQWAAGVAQIRQGLEAYAEEVWRTGYLAWLAKGSGEAGHVDEGLAAVAEALRLVEKNDERIWEAEVYRIKGQLVLESRVQSLKTLAPSPSYPAPKLRRKPKPAF
jgi:ATP/maltotriose-dependent transcriptional regulator MalT